MVTPLRAMFIWNEVDGGYHLPASQCECWGCGRAWGPGLWARGPPGGPDRLILSHREDMLAPPRDSVNPQGQPARVHLVLAARLWSPGPVLRDITDARVRRWPCPQVRFHGALRESKCSPLHDVQWPKSSRSAEPRPQEEEVKVAVSWLP